MGENKPLIQWHTDAFKLDFVLNENGVVCVSQFLPATGHKQYSASRFFQTSALPLVSIKIAGEGNTADKTAKALVGSYLSARLKYVGHQIRTDGNSQSLQIHSADNVTKISTFTRMTQYGNVPVIQSTVTARNDSTDSDVVVTQLSSWTIGGMTTNSDHWFDDYSVLKATNGWFREAQWREHSLSELGIDDNGIYGLPDGHSGSQATFSLQNRGSFSTGSFLPMGLLKSRDDTDTWLWQVEHNGSWKWEIGDYKDSIYLVAGGPTATDHNWKEYLHPGDTFTTVPVAVTRVRGGIESAFAVLTDYRRQIMRPHEDNANLPIVFNDYMNCLMGDPDEGKILALLEPVARSGAEYFVIDAGWYADDSNWWDDVGLWEPSKKRFPSGFKSLLDQIRSKGLTPGLWLEPEVVGVRSSVAKTLPEDAFFQENGQRVKERGRYQLDYRHPAVRARMDGIIHNLVVNYGAGFFKFDYNIEVLQGTDAGGSLSAGVAHLEHQRAYLAWVRSLLDSYPGLVIENCSSGAQRMDYAMLAVHPIQSTSDQQDPVLYSAIAAAVPTAVTPEQSATWAYPQARWSDEINALTVVNSLLGRVYLSGRLDELSPEQFNLVLEGMNVYKSIRHDLRIGHPFWPLGLPRWHDDWLALGIITPKNGAYLAVWRRGGATEMTIPLKNLREQVISNVELLYPRGFKTEVDWDSTNLSLSLKFPLVVCARLFHIRMG